MGASARERRWRPLHASREFQDFACDRGGCGKEGEGREPVRWETSQVVSMDVNLTSKLAAQGWRAESNQKTVSSSRPSVPKCRPDLHATLIQESICLKYNHRLDPGYKNISDGSGTWRAYCLLGGGACSACERRVSQLA